MINLFLQSCLVYNLKEEKRGINFMTQFVQYNKIIVGTVYFCYHLVNMPLKRFLSLIILNHRVS